MGTTQNNDFSQVYFQILSSEYTDGISAEG